MMTSEQIQQLRRDETAMMAEWSASSVQPCRFNTDGIVDYERWALGGTPGRKAYRCSIEGNECSERKPCGFSFSWRKQNLLPDVE